MAPLRRLTLCCFAESWEGAGGWGQSGGHFLDTLLIIPILTWIWRVFPQESAGAILHSICHRDGWHEQLKFPPALSPKGLWERDVAVNLTHHPFLGEVEWAEGGLDVCAGDTGSCGNIGECPRSPAVHTAGPEVSPGQGR